MGVRGKATVAASLAGTLIAAGAVIAEQEPSPESRFPPPPGYQVVSQSVAPEAAFDVPVRYGVIPGVSGRMHRATYRPAPGAPRPPILSVLRHYRDRLLAAGGQRLGGVLNVAGAPARISGRIPGDRPVWLHAAVDEKDLTLTVTVLQEPEPTLTEFDVPEEAIPGRWQPASLPSHLDDAARAEVDAVVTRFQERLQPLPVLSDLKGLHVWLEVGEEDGATGTMVAVLFFRPLVQACGACDVEPSGDAGRIEGGLRINVNTLGAALEKLEISDEAGGPLYATPAVPDQRDAVAAFSSGWLVRRSSQPPVLEPLTREAFLRARIRAAEGEGALAASGARDAMAMASNIGEDARVLKEIAETRRAAAALIEAISIKPLRDELARLSPAERAAAATDDAGRAIVRLTAAAPDPSLGVREPRFLVLEFLPVREFQTADLLDQVRRQLTPSMMAEWMK